MTLRLIAGLFWFTSACSIFACSIATGAFAADSPTDFAFAVPVEGVGGDALYRIAIAPAVYEGSAFADLRDVRVFNANGEVVPHAFRPLEKITHQFSPVALPFFVLRGPQGVKASDLDIALDSTNGNISLRVKSRQQNGGHTEELLGYIVDLSARNEVFSELTLDWEATPGGYIGAVNVEASEDLKRWRRVVSDAPLVSLAQGGQQLKQKSVALRRLKTKYLRLTWPANANIVQLTSISGQPAEEVAPVERSRKNVVATADPDKHGDYLADMGGVFPIDRLRIRLPQDNAIVQVQIFARDKSVDEWRRVTGSVAYRLRQNGREIASPELSVRRTARRYWLLRVDQQGGGIGEGAIQLQAAWIAREIVFAARGTGPFLLAFGNSRAQPNALAIETLVPGWGGNSALYVAPATTGAMQTLAGETAARARVDMKKFGLWASLFAGVAVLGFMAWRISRQLQSNED